MQISDFRWGKNEILYKRLIKVYKWYWDVISVLRKGYKPAIQLFVQSKIPDKVSDYL